MIEKILNIPSIIRLKFYPIIYRRIFRTKDIVVGDNIKILGKVSIIGSGKITIGDNFCLTSGEHINPICANMQASFYTDSSDAKIQIGDNVGMSSTRIWIHEGLTIGNNVKIGGGVLIIDTDCHSIDWKVRRNRDNQVCSAPITIEDDVWIGAQCVILKGVTIGARSIIGAGSVVTKSISPDCIAAGNPCKIIKKLNYME